VKSEEARMRERNRQSSAAAGPDALLPVQGGIVAWFRARYRPQRQRAGVWIMTAALMLFLAFAAPNFYGEGNIQAVLNDSAILGIGAAGMTVLIMAGAFDLSVTSIVGLAPIAALRLVGDSNGPLTVLVSVLAGAALGLINGLIMLGVNSYWHYLATGIILILAIALGLLGGGKARSRRA
jgi:ribose/xylose/arabinose/galactoside ABC-type transport system permease subunit